MLFSHDREVPSPGRFGIVAGTLNPGKSQRFSAGWRVGLGYPQRVPSPGILDVKPSTLQAADEAIYLVHATGNLSIS